jgi:DNA-binding NarL/FixJ family response regulator
MAVRLLVVDDHAVVRQSLVRLLSKDSELEVVGEAADGYEAVKLAEDLAPDLVLMDLYMPGLDGVEAIRRIKQSVPSCEVVVLTASLADEDVVEAVQAGARGYILKTADAHAFLRQVREAASGKTVMSPEVTSKLIAGLSAESPSSRVSLPEAGAAPTGREQQVLDLISRGFTNKQMAEALAISENTVRAHVRSLMQKLRVDNRTRLAVHGLREGRGKSDRGVSSPNGSPQAR